MTTFTHCPRNSVASAAPAWMEELPWLVQGTEAKPAPTLLLPPCSQPPAHSSGQPTRQTGGKGGYREAAAQPVSAPPCSTVHGCRAPAAVLLTQDVTSSSVTNLTQ